MTTMWYPALASVFPEWEQKCYDVCVAGRIRTHGSNLLLNSWGKQNPIACCWRAFQKNKCQYYMPNKILSIHVLCDLGKVIDMKDQIGQSTFSVLGMQWKTRVVAVHPPHSSSMFSFQGKGFSFPSGLLRGKHQNLLFFSHHDWPSARTKVPVGLSSCSSEM